MKRSVVALLVMVAFAIGYWAGFAAGDSFHDRVERTRTDESTSYSIGREREADPAQVTLGKRLRELRKENEQLRERLAVHEPSTTETEQAAPEPGTRLENGTIVGGARWSEGFNRLATGFLDTMLSNFIRNANLSPQQERRVRSLILKESRNFLQVSADFTNGDIDGEQAYEQLEGLSADLRGKVGEMLDDEQRANFGNLQKGIRNMLRDQIVNNEMATLKSTLRLDSDQEAKIAAIVEERYKRVEDKTNIPIPNVFFKPLRRESDQTIYDETADAIRAVLDSEQIMKYDDFESKAPAAPFVYRSQLVAK